MTSATLAAALLSGDLSPRRYKKAARHITCQAHYDHFLAAITPKKVRKEVAAGIAPYVRQCVSDLHDGKD